MQLGFEEMAYLPLSPFWILCLKLREDKSQFVPLLCLWMTTASLSSSCASTICNICFMCLCFCRRGASGRKQWKQNARSSLASGISQFDYEQVYCPHFKQKLMQKYIPCKHLIHSRPVQDNNLQMYPWKDCISLVLIQRTKVDVQVFLFQWAPKGMSSENCHPSLSSFAKCAFYTWLDMHLEAILPLQPCMSQCNLQDCTLLEEGCHWNNAWKEKLLACRKNTSKQQSSEAFIERRTLQKVELSLWLCRNHHSNTGDPNSYSCIAEGICANIEEGKVYHHEIKQALFINDGLAAKISHRAAKQFQQGATTFTDFTRTPSKTESQASGRVSIHNI